MNKLLKAPIFIIGAGRSGTNILRDSLTSFQNLATWPCDEINLIFRHGNRSIPHDEFEQEQVNEVAKRYVIHAFQKFQRNIPEKQIVEKTCANSLRIPFLNSIFPKAKFIFIVRDGYDVAASAIKRWRAPIEPAYLLKKLRFVPKSDIPYYTLQFVKNRLKQWQSNVNQQEKWGPVYKGMQEDLLQSPLFEVAAKQWARCVVKASSDLIKLESDRVWQVTYENFVQNPAQTLGSIGSWLDESWTKSEIESAIQTIRTSSMRKSHNYFNALEIKKIKEIIEPVMVNVYDPIAKDFQTSF